VLPNVVKMVVRSMNIFAKTTINVIKQRKIVRILGASVIGVDALIAPGKKYDFCSSFL
jgi:uncharacterized protein affecting Mg2+/Co2+ transport